MIKMTNGCFAYLLKWHSALNHFPLLAPQKYTHGVCKWNLLTGVNIDGQIDGLSAGNEGSYMVSVSNGGGKKSQRLCIILS